MQEQTKNSNTPEIVMQEMAVEKEWVSTILTLDNAWRLYSILQHCIDVEYDDVSYRLEKMNPGTITRCLNILFISYPINASSLELAAAFFECLDINGFSSFVRYIRSLHNGR